VGAGWRERKAAAAFRLECWYHRGGEGVGISKEFDREPAAAVAWEPEFKNLAEIGTDRKAGGAALSRPTGHGFTQKPQSLLIKLEYRVMLRLLRVEYLHKTR
jgi:hypothetical protein